MRDKYVYLIASLEYLVFNRPSSVTEEGFLSECAKWLDQADLEVISKTSLNEINSNEKDYSLMKEWKNFNKYLLGEISVVREDRKKGIYERYPVFVKDVFEESNPLSMEMKIEEKRWHFLEEKGIDHHFDIESLIIYFLKLKISKRLASFHKEKGKNKFEQLCEVNVG